MGLFGRSKGKQAPPPPATTSSAEITEVAEQPPESGYWERRLQRWKYEVEHRPDYTRTPEVEAELARIDRAKRVPELSEEQKKKKEEFLNNNELVKFLLKSEEVTLEHIEEERMRNSVPCRKDDTKMWQSLPPVPGPFGGPPLIRKAILGQEAATDKFWDFFKQFEFGLWGYRQRPYPPERPIDITQVLGHKWLHKRYADYTMRGGPWYYKDRLGRTRGPMELINLKTAWAGGIVDKNTFIWGDDMDEWAPIGMVYGLEQCIKAPDVVLGAAGTDMVHKIARGISLFAPRKGHEPKTYEQLQKEALEKRRRENAVLRLNGGVWPGEKTPAHALFLWASGSQLTKLITPTSPNLPDKFVTPEMRKFLKKTIPGLRPRDIIDIEKVMDFLTFGHDWNREKLGALTTRADYEREYFERVKEKWENLVEDIDDIFSRVEGGPKIKLPTRSSGVQSKTDENEMFKIDLK